MRREGGFELPCDLALPRTICIQVADEVCSGQTTAAILQKTPAFKGAFSNFEHLLFYY
jgi:hypothetical protein